MPILVDCPCGKKLQAREDLLGKQVRCPACSGVATVERILDAIPEPALVEETAIEPSPPRPTWDKSPDPNAAPRPILEDDETIYDREHRRRRRPRTPSGSWWASGPGQFVVGLSMAISGIVWLVVGLLVGILFHYPFFLIVVGIIAAVKGLVDCTKRPAPIDDDDGFAPDDGDEDDSRHQ